MLLYMAKKAGLVLEFLLALITCELFFVMFSLYMDNKTLLTAEQRWTLIATDLSMFSFTFVFVMTRIYSHSNRFSTLLLWLVKAMLALSSHFLHVSGENATYTMYHIVAWCAGKENGKLCDGGTVLVRWRRSWHLPHSAIQPIQGKFHEDVCIGAGTV